MSSQYEKLLEKIKALSQVKRAFKDYRYQAVPDLNRVGDMDACTMRFPIIAIKKKDKQWDFNLMESISGTPFRNAFIQAINNHIDNLMSEALEILTSDVMEQKEAIVRECQASLQKLHKLNPCECKPDDLPKFPV